MTDVKIRKSRLLTTIGGWLTGRNRPMGAVTIRHTIYTKDGEPPSPRLLRHELIHVKQWEKYPWTFPIRYGWNHIKYGYVNNPFEKEAEKAEKND